MKRFTLVLVATLGAAPAVAQTSVAFPYYNASQVWQGLYQHHLPSRAKDFDTAARRLHEAIGQDCGATAATHGLQAQWERAMLAWQRLGTPAMGPVLQRRTQRQIDFAPIRLALLERALAAQPISLADMERVGTPAKGFGALQWVLDQTPSPERCRYAGLLAEGIALEAKALQEAITAEASRDLAATPEAVGKAYAEWVNQWLGGWERLRWQQIEQPLHKARTSGKPVEWQRHTLESSVTDWRTQWQALQAQARLSAAQRQQPPQPGAELIPLEALLVGKGQLALAQRWAQALDRVQMAFDRLGPQSSTPQLLLLAKDMKAVTALYQNEVAAALDVPLGFSDADGD